ncbi:MAG: hypothetical protein ACLPHP_01075 [Candidatus Sulfotelmatobacter sp.]
MSFILIPSHGEHVQVNAWNWRPTLLLLHDANLIDKATYELMGANGCGGHVDAGASARIADFLELKLQSMQPGQRIRGDLSTTDKPKMLIVFTPGMKVEDVDAKEAYSATYEWLVVFRDFCRASGGFRVS